MTEMYAGDGCEMIVYTETMSLSTVFYVNIDSLLLAGLKVGYTL